MRGILMTDWGEYELPPSVEEKIAAYPTVKVLNPFTDEVLDMEIVDFNHPVLARYMRAVTNHVRKEAGA